jgi:predicted methyltransferase MtxX (methanogen marker protein 4)
MTRRRSTVVELKFHYTTATIEFARESITSLLPARRHRSNLEPIVCFVPGSAGPGYGRNPTLDRASGDREVHACMVALHAMRISHLSIRVLQSTLASGNTDWLTLTSG